MMLVAGFLNTVCTLSIGHSSYQCLQCLHYCDYPHPLTTQLTISQHDAPCPAPGRVGGCGRGKVLRSRQTKTAADYFLRWRKYFPSEESWSVIMSAVAGRLTAR